MRVGDRLFAFWRLPAWTDAVQVLLWLIGWAVVVGVSVLLVVQYGPLPRVLTGGPPGELGVIVLVAVVGSLLITLGWAAMGCWFVSAAYGGWRRGHRHGKQWALVIAILLLMSPLTTLALASAEGWAPRLDRSHAALLAVQTAFGLALLVAALTTKPPAALPITPAA